MVGAVLRQLPVDKLHQSHGGRFHGALSGIFATLQSVDSSIDVARALKFVSLPGNPAFLFGFAKESRHELIQLSHVSKVSIDLSGDPEALQKLAVEQSAESMSAFSAFHRAGMLKDEHWLKIAGSLAKTIVSEDIEPELFDEQLKLLSSVASYISAYLFKSKEVEELIADATFYKSLFATYSSDTGNLGVADAIFLASKSFLGRTLVQPTRTQRISSVETEFAWLNDFLTGLTPLSQEQLEHLVDRLTSHYQVSGWLNYGNTNPDNSLAQDILRTACARSPIPWIHTANILKFYPYIKTTLGANFTNALPALGRRLSEDDVKKTDATAILPPTLLDTKDFAQEEWRFLHERTDTLLNGIAAEAWNQHFLAGDDTLKLLRAKASSSGFLPMSTALKDAFLQFVVGTLNGSLDPASPVDYDFVMQVIDDGYHLELYKAIRENLKSTSADTISRGLELFPTTLRKLVTTGSKSKQEKANLIRFVLKPALEGGLSQITDAFLELKRPAVADFIKSSDESVKSSLEPALRLFSSTHSDNRAYMQKVADLVQGKKGKSWFQKIIGGASKNDDASVD